MRAEPQSHTQGHVLMSEMLFVASVCLKQPAGSFLSKVLLKSDVISRRLRFPNSKKRCDITES